jgi:MtN3 and saliva related transmembrane protein
LSDFETFIGYFAAMLTTCAFLPQAWRIYKTKNTQAISIWMYLIFSLGVFLWLIYGFLIGAWPIVVANGVTLLLSTWILWMKINE